MEYYSQENFGSVSKFNFYPAYITRTHKDFAFRIEDGDDDDQLSFKDA